MVIAAVAAISKFTAVGFLQQRLLKPFLSCVTKLSLFPPEQVDCHCLLAIILNPTFLPKLDPK